MSGWQELNIHIHTVLHLNKGDDNTRGHLGTELNNKAESILQITKSDLDANYSTVAPKFIRDIEFEPFTFFIDDGIPVLDENFDTTNLKSRKGFSYQELSEENHREVLQEMFKDGDINCTYEEYVTKLRDAYLSKGFNFGINKAKQLKTFLENKRMIIKNDKTYRFNPEFYY